MDRIQALHAFWSSFGWAAYDANTVPSKDLSPEMPRITYSIEVSDFDDPVSVTASLWDQTYSWENITRKADEIYRYIGFGGRVIQFDGGYIWIKRGTPFYTRMGDPDDTIRRIVMSISLEYFNE